MKASPLLALLVWGVAGAGMVLAQASPPDRGLMERQFKAARELERDGQIEPARQALTKMLEQDPSGPLAADVHLALARLSFNVTEREGLGGKGIDAAALDSAREHLEAIRSRFPSAAVAPEAIWRLALILLEPGSTRWDPDQALGLLTQLPTVYPDSKEAPQALALASELQISAGRISRARNLAFRLVTEWPDDPAAVRGWLMLAQADARDGKGADALVAAARARASAQAAKDEAGAAQALTYATILDRVLFASTRGSRPFEIDWAGAVLLPGKAKALAADPTGKIWAALPSENQIIGMPPGKGTPETRQGVAAQALVFDEWGRLWSASDTVLVPPAGTGGLNLPERTEILAIAPVGPRALWVADGRQRRLIRIESGGKIQATARFTDRVDPAALVPDGVGGVWVVDNRAGALVRVAADGALLTSVKLSGIAADPVALARDPLGFLYLLDADAPGLLILAHDGKVLLRQPLPKEGEQAFGKPTQLAVDPHGAVAVFDSRKRRLVWMR